MKAARLALIVGFYVAVSLYFLGAQLVDENARFHLFGPLILPIIASTTCMVDSFIIGKPLSLSTRWMTAAYWPVTVLYYLIWSRSWRNPLVAAIHFTLLAGTVTVASFLGVVVHELLVWAF